MIFSSSPARLPEPRTASRAASFRRVASAVALNMVIQLPASAATIEVDSSTGLDADTCSLAEAIGNANSGDLHADCVAGDPGTDTIKLTVDVVLFSQLPDVTSQIVLQGSGFSVKRSDTASPFSVFRLVGAGDLSLHNTTVTNGKATSGGGIYNNATLLLSHSTVSNNLATYAGGGIANLSGTVTLVNSTVSDNSVDVDYASILKGGGIYNDSGTVTITGSTISGNVIGDGGIQGHGGGIYNASGVVNLTNSTVSGNTSFGYYAGGGGIYTGGGTVSLLSSTVSGNAAIAGYGRESGTDGIAIVDGSVSITNSTVSGHQVKGIAPSFEGSVTLTSSTLFDNVPNLRNFGSATLRDTLLGQSSGGPSCQNFGTLIDDGGNLATDTSCGTIPGTLNGVDPSLADNGGPTETHALVLGSNAIDHAGTCAIPFDQRGNPRDDGACDAGAFEIACYAPDGAYVLVETDTVTGYRDYEACWQIAVGDDVTITGPSGELDLRSGREVVIFDGFSVEEAGILSITLDPSLQMPPRPKLVFVSSDDYFGNLGGLSGADAECNALASAAGRSGTFKAWLSDSSCAVADTCRGFTKASVPYIRPDGVRVADNWSDLIDGSLQQEIDVDEYGGLRGGFAWTNTTADGSQPQSTDDCDDWTAGGITFDVGRVGCLASETSDWTDCESQSCVLEAHLYCFEQ